MEMNVEQLREELNNYINEYGILNSKTIEKSQELDRMLNIEMANKNFLNQMKLTKDVT